MKNFSEGDVVISTVQGQAGTVIQVADGEVWVLLRNGDLLTGPIHQIRFPQNQADLDAAPVDVERIEQKRSAKPYTQE